MPAGETEKSPSAWTIDSLHQHLTDAIASVKEWAAGHFLASERRIDAAIVTINDKLVEMDRRYEERFRGQQAAIAEKDKATDDRLEGMNEFRQQLGDQTKTFMPRSEAEQQFSDLRSKHSDLDSRVNAEVRRIDNRLDTTAGGVSGADKYRATAISALAAALGLAAFITSLLR